MIQGINTSLKY